MAMSTMAGELVLWWALWEELSKEHFMGPSTIPQDGIVITSKFQMNLPKLGGVHAYNFQAETKPW